MNNVKIPKSTCPKCGYLLDTSTSVFDDCTVPKAGDVSLCLACGEISVFNKDLTLRVPTKTESEHILHNPQVLEAQLVRAEIVGDKIKERMANESAK